MALRCIYSFIRLRYEFRVGAEVRVMERMASVFHRKYRARLFIRVHWIVSGGEEIFVYEHSHHSSMIPVTMAMQLETKRFPWCSMSVRTKTFSNLQRNRFL